MKIKSIALLLSVLMCVCLTACGSGEAKRPIDYPETKWTCDTADITFSVSRDCKVTEATMVNKNGETIDISFVFSEMSEGKMSITNSDGTETYLSGTCSYENDKFTVFVTDIYNTDLDISTTRLLFKRS